MPDKYTSFAQLAQHERHGSDYRIHVVERPDSPVLLLAPHGGSIEIGTSELAMQIAGEDHSLFAFEGLKPRGSNRDLHITSHRFDHPHCLALAARCAVALSIHGCIGQSQIYIGGLDDALTAVLARHLGAAGYPVSAAGHRYPGRNPLNICNRAARGRGAQLEFTLDFRGADLRNTLASLLRSALVDYLGGATNTRPCVAPSTCRRARALQR